MNKKILAGDRTNFILNLINPSSNDKILNIGISNIPEIEMFLEDKVKECFTIDIDKRKLDFASKFLKKSILLNNDVLTYKGFKNNYFDKVVMLEVLEHLDNDMSMLKKINSLLNENGSLILSVPSDSFLHIFNPLRYFGHKRHYSKKRIVSLLDKTGFKVTYINFVENWKLLLNLYVHLFLKFILRKNKKFGFFYSDKDSTYLRQNKKGMDIIIRCVKN